MKGNVITVSFFSKKTQMEAGEVVSEQGGFYLEKTKSEKRLCYKKGNLFICMPLTKKTFQRLKSLTSGVVLERADPYQNLSRYAGYAYDEEDDIYRPVRERSGNHAVVPAVPKVPAPFIHQRFTPE